MANIKGGRAARKRDRQNAKARKRNATCKAKLHDAHKKLFKAADANAKEDAEKKFKEFVSGLDKASSQAIRVEPEPPNKSRHKSPFLEPSLIK